jgi:glycerophosphoryl diester phosphodiesterase
MPDPFLVSVYTPHNHEKIRELMPDVALIHVVNNADEEKITIENINKGDMLCVYYVYLLDNLNLLKTAHSNQVKVLAYPVNETDAAKRLWSVGTDGFFTDEFSKIHNAFVI